MFMGRSIVLFRLTRWLAHTDDLRGRVTGKLPECAGEVGLIEIARLIYDIEDRHTLPQERIRPLSAECLPDVALR